LYCDVVWWLTIFRLDGLKISCARDASIMYIDQDKTTSNLVQYVFGNFMFKHSYIQNVSSRKSDLLFLTLGLSGGLLLLLLLLCLVKEVGDHLLLAVSTSGEALHGSETVLGEHGLVFVPAVAIGSQHLLTSEDGVGTSVEAQDLLCLAHGSATSGNSDDSGGHDNSCSGDGTEDGVEADAFAARVVTEWRTLDRDQSVDGERLGVGRHVGNGVKQTNMVLRLLAQTKNTTRADVDTSLAHVGQSFQTLVVGSGGDDGGVVLPRGVDIVVVCGQASRLELIGLVLVDHAECDADLHVHGAYALDHGLDVLQAGLSSSHVTPGCAHAEACASVLLCDTGFLEYVVDW
jgi:hypothetical protein